MRIMERLKGINRTLLEMQTGLLLWGVICQIVGMLCVTDRWYYTRGLWFGIAFAMISTVHMYRTLDRALDCGEKDAQKIIFRGYVIRYVLFVAVLFIIMITKVMNPIVVFMAYMGLKVTAYLQPITHKVFNKMFHETDPIPEALPEDVSVGEEISQEKKARR